MLAYLEFDGLSYNHSSSQCTSPDVMDRDHIIVTAISFDLPSFSEFIQNMRNGVVMRNAFRYVAIMRPDPFSLCIFGYLGKGLGVENHFTLRKSTR